MARVIKPTPCPQTVEMLCSGPRSRIRRSLAPLSVGSLDAQLVAPDDLPGAARTESCRWCLDQFARIKLERTDASAPIQRLCRRLNMTVCESLHDSHCPQRDLTT